MFKLLITIYTRAYVTGTVATSLHSQVIEFSSEEERLLAANNIVEKNVKDHYPRYEVISL